MVYLNERSCGWFDTLYLSVRHLDCEVTAVRTSSTISTDAVCTAQRVSGQHSATSGENMMRWHMPTRASYRCFFGKGLTQLLLSLMELATVYWMRWYYGSRGMRPSNTYKPRAQRWLNAKQSVNKSHVNLINKEEGFCSGPISTLLKEWRSQCCSARWTRN